MSDLTPVSEMPSDALHDEYDRLELQKAFGGMASVSDEDEDGCMPSWPGRTKPVPPPDPVDLARDARMEAIAAELKQRGESVYGPPGIQTNVEQPSLPPADVFESRARFPGGRVGMGAAAVGVAILVGAGITVAATHDGDSDSPAPAGVDSPGVGSTPTPGSTPGEPALVSGEYGGDQVVTEDVAGHKCCVKPASTWTVLQTRNTKTGVIRIKMNGLLPGIELVSRIPDTGATFTATDIGTVAGFAGTEVAFTGTVTPTAGIDGELVVGGNGSLPQGESITFMVDMQKQE